MYKPTSKSNLLPFYNSTERPNQSNVLLQQTCPLTGIVTLILCPAVLEELNLTIDYESVFSRLNACKKLASLPLESLNEVNNDILAGAYLTVCKSLSLVTFKDNVTAINAMLSTADKSTLVKALKFVISIKQHKAELLPVINLDYASQPLDNKNYNQALLGHLSLWHTELLKANDIISNRNISSKTEVYLNSPVVVKNAISKNTKSDYLKDFLVELKAKKAIASSAFKSVKPILVQTKQPKLLDFLAKALVGDNILYVAKDTREKLQNRLTALLDNSPLDVEEDIIAIKDFIAFGVTEEIGEDKQLEALERASDTMEKPSKKLSLKEMLEAKKSKSIATTEVKPTNPNLDSDGELPCLM